MLIIKPVLIFFHPDFLTNTILSRYFTVLLCQKPNYEVGSAAKLSFLPKADNKGSISAAWKIDSDGEEIVDADDLLDDDDKVKPDPTSLKGKFPAFVNK